MQRLESCPFYNTEDEEDCTTCIYFIRYPKCDCDEGLAYECRLNHMLPEIECIIPEINMPWE